MEQPNLMEINITEARFRINYAKVEMKAGYSCFQDIVNIWPEGNKIYSELYKYFSLADEFYDNLLEWCELINKPSFDIYNLSDKIKYQNFVLNNRQYSAEADFHYSKASELIVEFLNVTIV